MQKRMKVSLTALFLLGSAFFFGGTQAGDVPPDPVTNPPDPVGCPCTTIDTDIFQLTHSVDSLNFTDRVTPVLNVSGEAFAFIDGEDGPISAATRCGCGRVVVLLNQGTLNEHFDDLSQLLLSSLEWLSTGGKSIGVITLNNALQEKLTSFLNGTCFDIEDTTVAEIENCTYDILIVRTKVTYTPEELETIVAAVKSGKSLLLVTQRVGNNDNNLPQSFGITITDVSTSTVANITSPSQPDPTDCMPTMVDYGNKEPAEIKSIANNGFVVQEGIGAAYYGKGRVLLIGHQAILRNRDLSRENIDFIKEAISFVQDCNNCSCEIGYMMRGTPFKRLSKTLSDEGIDVPAVEITEDEMCTSCCVGINLGVIRGNNVDAEAVQEYVYNGGCLILTCPDASTNVRPINDLLEPFGLEIPKRKG